jgi:hypothetical protein
VNLRLFVDQGGRRVFRWPLLILVWVVIVVAGALGSGAASYALVGDFWRDFSLGVGFSMLLASFTVATLHRRCSPSRESVR